jgi:hypothetical protein
VELAERSMQLVAVGESAGGHWSQLATNRPEVPLCVQTLPRPSPEAVQTQSPGQLGVHIGWQNGGSPFAPGMHTCSSGQQSPPHTVSPGGQLPSHPPPTHSCPSSQRWKHSPQWRSFLCVFTHLSPQRSWPVGQLQTLSSPHLTQFLEQHWESLLHSLPKRLQSLAQRWPRLPLERKPTRLLGGRFPST